MSRAKIIGLLASHLVFGAIGLLLATGSARPVPSPAPAAAAQAPERPERPRPLDPSATSSLRPLKEWRGSEYAKAWDAVRGAKLNTKDRIETQRQLLQAWARVDLAAAMRAAIDEAWDDDLSEYPDPTGTLIGVFGVAFAEHPEESWELIRNGGFGLGAGLFRHVWIQSVGMKDPVHLASILPQLSWREREKAVGTCRMGAIFARNGPQLWQDLFDQLAAFPPEMVPAEQLAQFLAVGQVPRNVSKLREELLQTENPQDRLAGAKATVMGNLLGEQSHQEIAAAIEGVPDGLKQEILWAAFKSKPFNTADELTGMIDLLVAENAWEKLNQPIVTQTIQELSRAGAARAMADWATTLPHRPETTQIFHRGVGAHLRQDMQGAREWIAGIASREWRDRAYAEYSQQALSAKKDPAASRWALDQIQDPAFKATAEGWRRGWEQRNTPPGQ